jgi:carboxyl-terminal processing protease
MVHRLIVIFVFLVFCLNYAKSDDNSTEKLIEFQAQKLKYILETAYRNHPDSLNIVKICDEAFSTLLQSIDKESFYYSKQILKQVQENHKGITYGIGAEVVSINDTIYVIQVIPNTPAYFAGLQSGDIIKKIGTNSAFGLSKNEADLLIQGDSATTIEIEKIDVYSNKSSKLKIIRSDIVKPGLTTYYKYPNSDIGIFLIGRFSENIFNEFNNAVSTLLNDGVKRIIIDLRGNPGGYMTKVDEILDLFIGGNKILSKSVSSNPEFVSEIYSKNGDILEKTPLVVIIDENSASGSELLAGVVQDYDRGIIVGTRSYGKGTVQKIWNMNDTSGFKLTVGKYQTPSGRDIQKYYNDDFELKSDIDNPNVNTNEIKEKMKELGSPSNIKLFKSESGRNIIGGGGVFPDKFEEKDTLTQLTKVLIQRGIYFLWSIKYKKMNGKNLLSMYNNDYSKFNKEFQITDELLREFASFAVSYNIWNTDMFNQDKLYFITYMKASIANIIWGYDAFSEVMSVVDNQIVSAIKELPQAEKMILNK